MTKYYGGVGSRKTPTNMLSQMTSAAQALQSAGLVLRSGGAKGADTAFEAPVESENKQIFLAKHFTNEAVKIARQHHPKWQAVSAYGRLLLARNVFIVLGRDLQTPSTFILCWTPKGEPVGGTGHTINVAEAYGVPVFNMGKDSLEVIQNKIGELL